MKKKFQILLRLLKIYQKKKINNKTFFLTGCTGFFGIWILCTFNELIKKHKLNIEIYVLTRNKQIKKTTFIIFTIIKKLNLLREM